MDFNQSLVKQTLAQWSMPLDTAAAAVLEDFAIGGRDETSGLVGRSLNGSQ